MAGAVWSQGRSPETDLEDLRRPILQALCMACMAFAFLWIGAVATLEEETRALLPLVPPTALLVTSLISLLSSRTTLYVRSVIFLTGMGAAATPWLTWPVKGYWLFFQSLVIVVCGLLIGPLSSFVAAGAITGAALVVSALGGFAAPLHELLLPLALLWAIAIASWLSSRNLYTVLSWALSSQVRAWEAADEARRRREELRRTVDSLRTTHEILERTTRELELARREAERAQQLRTQFAADISHELRTPLNIILGFTEIMSRSPEVYGNVTWPPLLRGDIMEIRRNASHLSSLVDDVLDLARMDAVRMPIRREETDLSQVVSEAIEIVQRLLDKKPVLLKAALDANLPALSIDATRIRQVLINLLANACRFTEEGEITVTAREQAGEVIVCVADTGPGISPEHLDRVFDEFEQAGAWQRPEQTGKGLGLAIAKHLVQRHGGRIWAESELHQGTRMFFTLPVRRREPLTLLRSPRPAPQEPGSTALVVLSPHDYPATYLARHMEGYKVHHARTRAQAREMVAAWHPAAVIADINSFHDTDGLSLPDLALPEGVPIIGCHLPSRRLTNDGESEVTLLVKPVASDELLAVVHRIAPTGSIMVVDDDRGFAQVVERIFQAANEGERVRWACDGREALAKMRVERPALVLLDMVLPHMTGLALARAMQADPALASVPVVFVTGARLPEEALPTGGDAFIIAKSAGLTGDQVLQLLHSALTAVKPDYASASVSQNSMPGERRETGHARPAS
ncbi:MAG: ATP-binding protein [Anaerolineae bacterium]